MTPAEIASLLARTEVFASVGDAVLGEVADGCVVRRYRRRQTVVSEGEPGDALYVVADGMLAVSVQRGGARLVLSTVRPPDVFGEIAVLDGGLRSATLQAADASAVVILRRDALLALLERHPSIAAALLRYLAATVRRLTGRSADLALLDLDSRVARLLVVLAREGGAAVRGGREVDPRISQTDLAAMVGATRQSVNRALHALARAGDVSVARGRIVVSTSLMARFD